MQVTIHSRASVERLLKKGFPEKTAVISFYDPVMQKLDRDYRPVDYQDKPAALMQIPLFDSGEDEIDDYNSYFPEVEELAKFIRSAHENGLDIICQCDYGQSRSAGCAAAILQYFYGSGISVFADYRYYPNQMVFNKVLDALIKSGEQSEADDL